MKQAAIAWAVVVAALIVPVSGGAQDKPAAAKAEPAPGPTGAAAEQPVVPADPAALEQAKQRYLEGKTHYEAGRFAEALAAFTDAYNLSNKTDLLFNLGVCSEKLGQTDKAIAYYRLYLEENHDAADRDDVARRLAALEAAEPEEPAEPEAAVQPAPAAGEDELVVMDSGEDRAVFWPGAVIGLGGLLLAGGALTAIMAYNKYGDLEDSCAPDCGDAKVAEVKRAALAADIQFALGGAVVAAGVIWWVTSAGDESETGAARLRGAPVALGDGAGLALQGEF
jgi:tetratricopeptide (TPR) repeat protein